MSRHNQAHGQGRRQGGMERGVGEPREPEGAQTTAQAREAMEWGREQMASGYHRAEEMVGQNPASSVLVAFGVGFGVGLVLTTLFSRSEESWTDRHLPDSLRRAPDSIHHLAESLRNLPEAIARRIPSRG